MIIEQVDSLKAWLTSKLSPICDAEPGALAKYVCALVKKDKPEEDLRDICLDQLDVFLQTKTKSFVEELFEALKNKSYIPAEPASKPKPPPPPPRPPGRRSSRDVDDTSKKKSEGSSVEAKEPKDTTKDAKDSQSTKDPIQVQRESKDPPRDGKEPARDRDKDRTEDREKDKEPEKDKRDSWRDERSKEGIRDAREIIRENREQHTRDRGADTREVREPRDVREREFRDRERDFRLRRRSRSRSFSPRRRDFDDRRRRYDDRPRYSPDRRWNRRRSWSRSPRRRSPVDRPPRIRSRSPRFRSRSPRDRGGRTFKSRSRSPRPRSWSRPTSGVRYRTLSPRPRQPDSRGSTPVQDNDYSTLISSSTNELPAVTSTVGLRLGGDDKASSSARSIRPRCPDFEEKGFCVLGDACQYDHGTDPVVVEDVTIPNSIPAPTPVSGSAFLPHDFRVPPPGHVMRVNLRQPPPAHVEPYLPEAPRMRGPLPPRPPFMRGPPPPNLRPPPPGMVLNRPPLSEFLPPSQPRDIIISQPQLMEADGSKEPARIVIPMKRPYSAIEDNPAAIHIGPPPPRMAHINQHHHMFATAPPPVLPQTQLAPRKRFDFNRLGWKQTQRPAFKTGNLTLEVRKIPADLNNISKLNEHFGKFGNLTNIQVKYEGDENGALITFSNNGEATAAYRSPEPVFNNRFIKLFWHNPEKANNAGSEEKMEETPAKLTGGRVGDGINHPSLVLPAQPSIPPAHKLTLDNTKIKPNQTADTTMSVDAPSASDKSIVYTSSVGNIKKTVFNTSSVSSKPKSPSHASPVSTTKPADFVSRIEAIKRAEENRKIAAVKQTELEQKKQELLEKQIQQQKTLIETLEKKKNTMTEEEKKGLLKALKTISDAIDKVKYGTGAQKLPTAPTAGRGHLKFYSQEQQPAVHRGRGWSYGRGMWTGRGRGRGFPLQTNLDKRPRTLEVKGFELVELDEVKVHFQQFGEIEKFDLVEDIPSLFITFCQRPNAEMAILHASKFNNKKVLSIRWNQRFQMPRTESVQSSEIDDEEASINMSSLDEEALLAASGDDKSVESSLPATPQSVIMAYTTTSQDKEEDAENSSKEFNRSLSQDLLVGEDNFKASYTDDEDDDDHITVTVSNTGFSNSWQYTSKTEPSEQGSGDAAAVDQKDDLEDEDDLAILADPEIQIQEEPLAWD